MNSYIKNLKYDFSSGIVVFLVALPLCLGIALASGAPFFSGMIAGIIGGIVVGLISNSKLSVSGPAAGLAAIVLVSIQQLGSFDVFLLSVFLAGIIQLIFGFLHAGSISNYFPSNVIKGMLTAIGILIILKQIPHALGYDADSEGNLSFFGLSGDNTFINLIKPIQFIHLGATLVAMLSLSVLILWEKPIVKKTLGFIPGGLVAVLLSVLINEIFMVSNSSLAIQKTHLVNIPVANNFSEFLGFFTFPNFSKILDSKVWVIAFTLAIVASIETLLSIEAVDRLDKEKRVTDTNLELKAQGIGNLISGLIGGLPITSVIVRSSANVNSGAKSKLSTIIHGLLLLLSIVTIPFILNKIPLASLAAILLLTGYKLAKPSIFKEMWRNGKYQWIPFLATIAAIIFTDLLKGVILGLIISILYILKGNLKHAYHFHKEDYSDGDIIQMKLSDEVSFLNKAAIKQTLIDIPKNSKVIIDASHTSYIDYDVLELIKEFKEFQSKMKNIEVVLIGFKELYNIENDYQVENIHQQKFGINPELILRKDLTLDKHKLLKN
jgi:MFS superfamily sulfate permease-like transporter